MDSLASFLIEIQKAATEADERRASVLVEIFERARPEDYARLLSVVKDSPEVAVDKLSKFWPLIKIFTARSGWQGVVVLAQRAITLNEQHKQRRLT